MASTSTLPISKEIDISKISKDIVEISKNLTSSDDVLKSVPQVVNLLNQNYKGMTENDKKSLFSSILNEVINGSSLDDTEKALAVMLVNKGVPMLYDEIQELLRSKKFKRCVKKCFFCC